MQALGRLVSHEVVEHFATLLKQGDVPSSSAPPEAAPSQNVVRPAAFNRGSDARSTSNGPNDGEAAEVEAARSDADPLDQDLGLDLPIDEGWSERIASALDRPGRGDASRSELSHVLDKIEAAGSSMRLVEERAQRQAAWTQDFLAAAKMKLKDAEALVRDAESRCERLEKRAETAEVSLELAEQRSRLTETRLEASEKRLEAAEHRLEAALELARNAEMRCADATARAIEAERCVQDVLTTVAREFPATPFE